MLPLRFPWVWWPLGWLMILGVCAGSLVPGQHMPTALPTDKLLHAASYCLLMVWFSGLYERHRLVWVALLLFLLGLSLDGLQGMSSERSFEWLDVAANTGGILLGWLLALSVFERWCSRVERFFV